MDEEFPSTSVDAMQNDVCDGENEITNIKYPLILAEGKYFKVNSHKVISEGKSSDEDKIQASCVECKAVIKGSLKATSNFRLHLKRKHPNILSEYESSKLHQQIRGKRTKLPLIDKNKMKQTKLNLKTQFEGDCQKKKLDRNIINYIVQSMKPLSTVDDPNFVKIFDDLPQKLNIMSRRTLGRKIEISHKEIMEKLINILSKVEYLSTTADIWSTKSRSYFGVTAHWINANSLECNSCVLSFSRFKGTHTYDKIAEMLFEIQSSFKLKNEQIISTTTDNGSNFVKAFKEFGFTDYVPDFSDDVEDTVDATIGTTFGVLYEDVLLPANTSDDEIRQPHLPRHIRCASHTLSLLATTDMNNHIKNSHVSRIHYSAVGKCTLLWNMFRRPKSAEIIKGCLGHQLIYPCPTRWNSLYDSIAQLMKSKSKLNELFSKLSKVSTFAAIELEYLEEFIVVLKPIATALDYLQGNNCYYGKLLPTLMSVRTRLNRMNGNNLRHLSAIIPLLKESLEKRFDKFFKLSPEINRAILASCYHPGYKMRWLPENITTEERQRIQNLALYTLEENYKKLKMIPGNIRSRSTSKEEDDFVVFVDRDDGESRTSNLELEFVSFLSDKSKDIITLDNYPNIKRVFIEFNTSLCSSGPVERLFSSAGFIYSPTRNCLSDATFKNLIFMKGNKLFC